MSITASPLIRSTEAMSEDSASLPDLDEQAVIPEEVGDEDDCLVIMSDDAGQVYAPPARIAARFYRDSKSRRKSSAPSSRRNSMSSTHSHASSRSFRRSSTCQSSYVAQHLRRTSIIESRKARLADRAAHAEQVRLRAALAKATPRGDATASEERALAAQLAREKYLAKVAAACAEEVAKAKQKAQEMKARKLEEEERVRRDMEERLVDVEKRRLQYQRNTHSRKFRRASSLDKNMDVVADETEADSDALATENDVVDKVSLALDDDSAARRIQRQWRLRQRRTAVRHYSDLRLTLAGIRELSFEDMGVYVADRKVTDAVTKILRLFGLVDQDATETQERACTRSFLSAYLIITHPTAVLSKNGTQEQDLIDKARELIVLFESAMARLAPWNNYLSAPAQQDGVSQAYNTYSSAFDAWRAQDSSALVETMVASFVELDAIWQTVKDTREEVADDYRQGIRDNQVILLSKIRKLAGPDRADYLIKKAIRESRRRRGKRRTPAEERPRAAEGQPDEASPTSAAPAIASIPTLPQETTLRDQESASISLAKLFSPIPSNRILTHELAIDKEFRIPASAHSDVRDTINRALCDSMREGFERGMGTVWTVAMAQEIRAKLTHILQPGNSIHKILVDTLDLSLIKNQCEQGVFSYENFFRFMASILPKLCAPFRDGEVKVLAQDLELSDGVDGANMVEKLFRLLHFIDLLSLDYSNFLLMNAAPVLIRESVGYEQRMFAADLMAGTITLARTDRWWRNASVNMLTEADRRDPDQVRNLVDRPTIIKIYSRGLVDLAISQGTLEDSDVPETLLLDQQRLRSIRQKSLYMTTIGSILLVAKNLLKRDVRTAWKAEASRLWDLLTKELAAPLSSTQSVEDMTTGLAQRALAILESAHNLPPSTRATLQSTTTRIILQASQQRFTDPVAKVLYARLRSHVLLRVAARTSSERVRAASSASESLTSAGLPEFVGQIGEMVELLRKIADVDWASHGAPYEEIARNVADGGPAGS